MDVEKTEFGPGRTPLYYNNVGLFSDVFLEDNLKNIEKYYSGSSIFGFVKRHWDLIDPENPNNGKINKAFSDCYQDVMDLWNDLDQDVPKFCNKERQLQNSWIDKILEHLGWKPELEETVTKHGSSNFPDYALYRTKEDWKKSKDLSGNNKFKKALSVADAKDWGVNLDGKGFSNKNPSYQIINYLKQTDKTWGILTDGKYWRIYSVRPESKHTTFFEIDLIKILSTNDQERFKLFYNFFRVEAFESSAELQDRSFLDFVFEDGQFYSERVEKNLNDRVYKVVDTICKGFLENIKNPSEADLDETYEYSMYYLFKLMFVLNCESKGLLEVNKQDDYYECSLRKKCLEIKEQFESGKKWPKQPRTYNYINDLFELLKYGDKTIGVHGFGEEPFEVGSLDYYINNKITDDYLNTALLELACDYDDDGNLQFIDYKIMSPDHIGSMFEGLLEFQLKSNKRKIELVNTKGERKATGSYYTPEYLVDYIVEETLSELVTGKSPKEILGLKILDPSMGSGHFLLGVVKYIEKTITDIQEREEGVDGAVDFDKIRKTVLHNCVFGVDINALATQLAKFSLWIYTSQKGDELEPLYDQLITQNSLIDEIDWSEDFEEQISEGTVDAIVGNPPYIGEKGNKKRFQTVKNSSLGKRFYQGKMDYFYFFFHKTLDLLKEGGSAGLVSTNYFGTALGAKKLRFDLHERATIHKIINFNELKIFKGAQGQHNQVTFFNKGKLDENCNIFYALESGPSTKLILESILTKKTSSAKFKTVSQKALYDGDEKYLRVNIDGSGSVNKILDLMTQSGVFLGSKYRINNGVHSQADFLSPKKFEKRNDKSKNIGDGIYVLDTKNENDKVIIQNINKSSEKKYLFPFFKNSDVRFFATNNNTSKKLIYINKQIDEISELPNIKKHLNAFKCIIDEASDNAPYLHRAKTKTDFLSEKIVVSQRSKFNMFGFNDTKWFASADVYFITKSNESPISLKALTSLLNSKAYYIWFYFRGKRKGEALELYKTPLSEAPLPRVSRSQEKELEGIFDSLSKSFDSEVFTYLNTLVASIFDFNSSDVKYIDKFYNSKVDEVAFEKNIA